jgi:hypothetical protein
MSSAGKNLGREKRKGAGRRLNEKSNPSVNLAGAARFSENRQKRNRGSAVFETRQSNLL